MARKKTAAEKADEQRRYALARAAERGVVYSEARKRLETDGVLFGNDGFAIYV